MKAERTLGVYGDESDPAGRERVWLAIIKLAEGDLAALRKMTDAALTDFRDVLAWAEYPEQMREETWRMDESSKEYREILERDRRQYEDWLNDEDD